MINEELGHIDYGHRRTRPLGLVQEFLARGPQHRMNYSLQLLHGGRIVHHERRQTRAIDLAIHRRPRECRLDGRHRLTLVEPVNGGVSVVNRDAGFREQLCGG